MDSVSCHYDGVWRGGEVAEVEGPCPRSILFSAPLSPGLPAGGVRTVLRRESGASVHSWAQ